MPSMLSMGSFRRLIFSREAVRHRAVKSVIPRHSLTLISLSREKFSTPSRVVRS